MTARNDCWCLPGEYTLAQAACSCSRAAACRCAPPSDSGSDRGAGCSAVDRHAATGDYGPSGLDRRAAWENRGGAESGRGLDADTGSSDSGRTGAGRSAAGPVGWFDWAGSACSVGPACRGRPGSAAASDGDNSRSCNRRDRNSPSSRNCNTRGTNSNRDSSADRGRKDRNRHARDTPRSPCRSAPPGCRCAPPPTVAPRSGWCSGRSP